VINYLFTLPDSLTLPAGRYRLAAESASGDDATFKRTASFAFTK
jgi:hypothetical protein